MIYIIIKIILFLISLDFFKPPLDLLYFTTPHRILNGIKNSLTDILDYRSTLDPWQYQGLGELSAKYLKLKDYFLNVSNIKEKKYFHDHDWFDYGNYYYYDVTGCPLLDGIPSVRNAMFSVMGPGEYYIAPHRAECNDEFRYHLTIMMTPGTEAWLDVNGTKHWNHEGSCVLFDHSWNHSAWKGGIGTRVVLILDVRR